MKNDQASKTTLSQLINQQPLFWANPNVNQPYDKPFQQPDIDAAKRRLERFAPYLAKVFPETKKHQGLIESPLRALNGLKKALDHKIPGRLYLKCDHVLPISGSIKARGGIYEVLTLAEEAALQAGLLELTDDYQCLTEDKFKNFFQQFHIVAGSTGNLGLSIGIMSAKLGFRVTVHMSSDAKAWKKDKLRALGVEVIEHSNDYEGAVAQGRAEAAQEKRCFFIDDEKSETLFLGYAVAAQRLARQLEREKIPVDENHPLHVYLPCGVGGGPGGVTYGLKQIYGPHVHCYFVEPTAAPCFVMGLASGKFAHIACHDLGLNTETICDGLAVGRASALVSPLMAYDLSGCFTVKDTTARYWQQKLYQSEGIYVEPSAATSLAPLNWAKSLAFMRDPQATHIAWSTGGDMVPEKNRQEDLAWPLDD